MKTNMKNITPAIVGKLPEATAKNIDRLAAYYSAGTAAILEHTAEARKYATAAAKKAQKAAKLAEDGQTVETMKTIKAARDKVSRAAEILAAGAITEAQRWELWDSYFGTSCTIPDTAEGLSQEIQNIGRMASDIYVIANNADSYVNGEKIDIIEAEQPEQEATAPATDPAEATPRGDEANQQAQEAPAPQEGGTGEGETAQTVDPEKVEAAKEAKKKAQAARLICEKLIKRHEVGVFVDLKKNTNEKAAAYVCDAIGILKLGGIITKEQAEAIRAINIETGRNTDGLGCVYERDEEKKREKLAETIIEALNNYIKTGRISVEKRTENVKNDQRAADVFEALTAAKEACESINEAITAKWLCESHGCEKITAEQHSERLEYLRNAGDKMDRLESLIVPSLMTAEELQAVVDYRTTGEDELVDMCNIAGDLQDRLETMEDEASMERMLDALARIFNADLEETQVGPVEGSQTTAAPAVAPAEAAPEGESCAVKAVTGEDTPEGVTTPTESTTEATAGTGAPTADDLDEWEGPEGVELPAEPDPVEYPLGVCRYRVKRGSFYKLGRFVLEVQPESGGAPLVRKFKTLENLMGWLSQWARDGGHVVEPYPDTEDPDDLTTQATEAQQGPPVGQTDPEGSPVGQRVQQEPPVGQMVQQGPPGLGLGVRLRPGVVCYVWAISFTRTIGSGPGTNQRPAARTGRAANRGPPT